jgi:hypothetical protein
MICNEGHISTSCPSLQPCNDEHISRSLPSLRHTDRSDCLYLQLLFKTTVYRYEPTQQLIRLWRAVQWHNQDAFDQSYQHYSSGIGALEPDQHAAVNAPVTNAPTYDPNRVPTAGPSRASRPKASHPRHRETRWKLFQGELKQLYLVQNKTLEEIRQHMSRERSFSATHVSPPIVYLILAHFHIGLNNIRTVFGSGVGRRIFQSRQPNLWLSKPTSGSELPNTRTLSSNLAE